MPVVFRQDGYRFHFFSREGDPLEPIHIHVAKGDADAKVWLRPMIRVARAEGLTSRELRFITETVIMRQQEIEDAWTAHFTQGDQSRV
jgi:Domain of unknown function (DUF4160)